MTTLQDIRAGLGRAWNDLSAGWQQLRERAGDALTRFQPRGGADTLETGDEQFLAHASRWGLLAAELDEDADTVMARLEAPGLEPDDFEIQVVDGVLLVRGEKRVRHARRAGHHHLMECAYGRFERAIPLPAAVDESRARALYRRGVLTITLPKAAAARGRRIEVKGA